MTAKLTASEKASRAAARAAARDAVRNVTVDVSDVPVHHKPVPFMWDYIARNEASMTRKEIIVNLIAMDFNAFTVRTQMSRYRSANGDRSQWYRIVKDREAAKIAA